MDNLFTIIKECVESGHDVSFKRYGMHFAIIIEYHDHKSESWLPMQDHFEEDKVIACIKFTDEKLIEEIKNANEKSISISCL